MKSRRVDNLFEQFKETKHWIKLPNLQKGLMLKTLEKARSCEATATELFNLMETIMQQKRKPILRARK